MLSLLTPGSATGTEPAALPSYVPHTTIMFSRSSHQLVKNCIEIFTVAVLVSMGCQPSAACVASAIFRSPAPFLHKRIFRLSLTLLLDKNKLMLSFRRLRRNSRSKFESSFLKGKLRIRQLRGQNLLGSFLFPLAEPDFLSDVQVNTPKTPAVTVAPGKPDSLRASRNLHFRKRENHYV